MNLGTPICFTEVIDPDRDRRVWKADGIVCRHCGFTVFMCDAITKKPLPANAVAERCNVCDEAICGRCKIKMNSGAALCSYFRDRIDRAEHAYAERLKLGSWS